MSMTCAYYIFSYFQSRAFIMKDLLEGCNSAHKVLTDDHKIKADPPLVEPLIKAPNTRKM